MDSQFTGIVCFFFCSPFCSGPTPVSVFGSIGVESGRKPKTVQRDATLRGSLRRAFAHVICPPDRGQGGSRGLHSLHMVVRTERMHTGWGTQLTSIDGDNVSCGDLPGSGL